MTFPRLIDVPVRVTFVLGIVLSLLVGALLQALENRAILAEEIAVVEGVASHLDRVHVLLVVLLVVATLFLLWRSVGDALSMGGVFLTGFSGVASAWLPGLALVSIGCLFLVDLRHEWRSGVRSGDGTAVIEPLKGKSLAGVIRGLGLLALVVFLLHSLACMTISLGESYFYTSSFSGLYSPEAFQKAVPLMVGGCILYGLGMSLVLILFVIAPLALFFYLGKKISNWGHLAMVRMVLSAMTGIPIPLLVNSIFEGEVEALGFFSLTLVLGMGLFYFCFLVLSANLRILQSLPLSRHPADSIFRLVLAYTLIPVFPVLPLLSRWGLPWRRPILGLLSVAGLGAVIAFLVMLLYPDLVDYSTRAENLYAAMLIFLTFLVFHQILSLVWGQRPLSFRVLIPLTVLPLSLAFFPWYFFQGSQEIRLIANQYSRINQFCSREAYFRIHNNELGFSDPGGESFEYYAPRHAVLPSMSFHPEHRKSPPPIFIYVFDALRSDKMNVYGYAKPTTPNINAFSSESVVFRNHYSGGTATTVALRHLFTGRYSTRYMLERERVDPFFVKELLEIGYRDFFCQIRGSDYNGVSLEAFERNLPPGQKGMGNFEEIPRIAETETVAYVDDLLSRHLSRNPGKEGHSPPFFMFLHNVATHFPWRMYPESPDWGQSHAGLYDNNVHFIDRTFGAFLEVLKKHGLYDEAIIILTSDHGTGLGDHGISGGFQAYEEQMRIPLLVKFPGVKPRSVDAVTSSIDLAPTLANWFVGGKPNRFHGVSLMPVLLGEEEKPDRRHLVGLCAFNDSYTLMEEGRWKLHYHRRRNYWILYDLLNDPREERPLTESEPEITRRLTDRLSAFLWQGRGWYGNPYHYKPWPAGYPDLPSPGETN